MLLASIPSPSSGQFDLPGPLPAVHAYGLTLLLAIVAAIVVTKWRWGRRPGDLDLILRVAVWGVAAGIVGARLYHVVTSWEDVPDPKWKGVFEVWEGGLGIWGGILFGVLAGAIVIKRSGGMVLQALDAVAPALLVAQGIGRLGNWWNQELYGKPTDLPWGLEIDDAHNQDFPAGTTFHPTFLYELLWDFAGAAVVIFVARRWRIRPPALFSLYVSWYTFGRFFEEQLRIDPSTIVWGMRLNAWVSLVVFIASSLFFIWWQIYDRRLPGLTLRRSRRRRAEGRPAMAVPRARIRPRR
ncbi:MAG TPA: prolipoprotein diacylglyceryl transferase [Gaiellaceae bacterium]|nr:prolipoprotein diacylglyceryl transferase [Gaiellaceae bacterium]